MIEYKVLADDPQKGLVVQGNFAPGSIPVNIPHSNPKRKQYISLFLNLRDIEAGIDYLQCISPNNHLRINEGLFISALGGAFRGIDLVDHAEHVAAALTAQVGTSKSVDGRKGTGNSVFHRHKSGHQLRSHVGFK